MNRNRYLLAAMVAFVAALLLVTCDSEGADAATSARQVVETRTVRTEGRPVCQVDFELVNGVSDWLGRYAAVEATQVSAACDETRSTMQVLAWNPYNQTFQRSPVVSLAGSVDIAAFLGGYVVSATVRLFVNSAYTGVQQTFDAWGGWAQVSAS
jgi:hypothetical protein